MGKITDSIISGTSGRTGRIVVANVDGIEISRIRPKKSTKEPSPKQILVKNRFNLSINFVKSYKEFAKEFFGVRHKMKSTYNQALGNVMNALQLDMDNLTITPNYNHIQFCKGKGVKAQPTAISSPNPMAIQINWENNAIGTEAENDYLVILLAQDQELENETLFFETQMVRKDTSYELQLLPRYQNKEMHVWMAFVDQNKKYVSNSTYIGSILVS